MNLVHATLPELEFAPFDEAAITVSLARAFTGLCLVKEAQVKLQDCFALTAHPTLCEGHLPMTLSLHTPDGKRLASTTDWPKFQEREWPKHRQAVANKFPGVLWR